VNRRLIAFAGIWVLLGMLTGLCFATSITGTVTNKTRNKPSAGDDVVLLKLAQGMEEVARAKTDAKGRFTLDAPEDGAQHLVRVTHQGANYHRPAPQGTTAVEVDVYDVAKEVSGITGTSDVIRLQADNSRLSAVEMFTLQNDSKPPRTRLSERSFEIALPQGAALDSAAAAGPGGMPVTIPAIPAAAKGRYSFMFPIRPGETRFQVTYHFPYSGKTSLRPEVLTPTRMLVVLLPKSMEFSGSAFQPAPNPQINEFVAGDVHPGQDLSFTVSATGQLPAEAGTANPASAMTGTETDSRPGGGLGVPENSPDPMKSYRWFILAVLAGSLAFGGFYILRGPRSAARRTAAGITAPAATPPEKPIPPVPRTHDAKPHERQVAVPGPDARSTLLAELKEEFFRLETERLQARISQSDYEQAKAGIERLLSRSLAATRE